MYKKKDIVKLDGYVKELLPNKTFRVKLKNNKLIFAYLSGNMVKNKIRVIPDDLVVVEFSKTDFCKGRIVYRK